MTNSGPPPQMSQDDTERQWRLETLQWLEQQDLPEEAPVKTSLDEVLSAPDEAGRQRSRRRWHLSLIAGVLIVTLAAVVVARFAPGLFGARDANTPRPLTPVVFTLPGDAAIYCPSMPAWSPDGKYIAVMVRVFQPVGQGVCDYGDLVSGAARQELTDHGPRNLFYEGPVIVFMLDAKTGGVVRQLKPVDLAETLCKGASYCDASHITPVSLSWTPDGASVVVFSTLNVQLTGADGQGYNQTRGALEIMRADGAEATRALVAYGRETSTGAGPGGGILPVNIYSPPLFTWDLATGSARYTDIHEAGGVETVNYAPAFQVGPTGKLTPAQAPSAGSITPWSYGALLVPGNSAEPLPYVQFQSSVWAWSADGRYVVPDVDTTAYMSVKNVTPTAPPGYPGGYNPPFVAPPDAAIADMAREITPMTAVIYVARDPRGARLASFACQPNVSIGDISPRLKLGASRSRTPRHDAPGREQKLAGSIASWRRDFKEPFIPSPQGRGLLAQSGKLTIRATATGKTLLTTQYSFPTVSTSYGCPGDAEAINWSPDGSRVAMTDSLDNQIIIWQVPPQA